MGDFVSYHTCCCLGACFCAPLQVHRTKTREETELTRAERRAVRLIGAVAVCLTTLVLVVWALAWLLFGLPEWRLQHLYPKTDWAFQTVFRQYIILLIYDRYTQLLVLVGVASGLYVRRIVRTHREKNIPSRLRPF